MRIKRSTLVLWQKRLVVFLGASFVASLLYVYFGTGLFTITTYELVGVPDIYKETVTKNLSEISKQKTLMIFPGNRVLGYHSKEIKKSVVSVLPNTMEISVSPRGLHTLKIEVIPYTPFLKIDTNHAITKEGVIYEELQDVSSLVTLLLATSSPRKNSNNHGITVVSVDGIDTAKLESVISLVSKINSVIFSIRSIGIDEFGDISLYNEGGSSKIMFAGTQDTDKVWSNLLSAIDTDPLKSKLSNNKDSLLYLDARFGNKVFYKFTNDTKTAIIQSYATTTEATTTPSH